MQSRSGDASGPDQHGRPANPCTIVIFGSSGDLTKRKLIPALYNLSKGKLLPKEFAIIGFARSEGSDAAVREQLAKDIREYATGAVDPRLWNWFEERLHYVGGNFNDPKSYEKLKEALAKADKQHGTRGNYLFYLATPPGLFAEIVQQLGNAGLTAEENGQWRRVIVEKPFGRDLDSARALNGAIGGTLSENQIYRIDHYLGKETVQNILVFRFSNGIFEPIWNRQYIDHVQITVAESVGVEQRAGYYETSGALRDMVQNHLFQLLALIAMEPPISFEAEAVRDEKAKALRSVQPISPEDVLKCAVRGQYGDGMIGSNAIPAYRSSPGVNPSSNTESFVALKLFIENWRWAGVPFYLRTGKAMKRRVTEIAIQFKRAPHVLFRGTEAEHVPANFLVLHIQPREGISLSFQAKVPGPVVRAGAVDMEFEYSKYFGSDPTTGYETLLYDCMLGDATLFQRADTVEVGWQVVTPILDVWAALRARGFPNYAAGSWGPDEAAELLEQDGRAWRKID
ncbi:MAG: glucose-6-phosphate dehydrogenase [Planctomycetes bacterium]|nr:glucose-6-phosphate dehydrogenase [Planctomycetota bacterium]